jgi:hypothetical protein
MAGGMTSRRLLAAAGLGLPLAACAPDFGDLDLAEALTGCALRILPGDCVDAEHPVAFAFPEDHGLALGAEVPVVVLIDPSLGTYRIASSGPDVVEVREDADGIVLRGVAAGAADVFVVPDVAPVDEAGAPIELETLFVAVAPIERTAFEFTGAGGSLDAIGEPPPPLADLDALIGGEDDLYVAHLAADGTPLLADGLIELTGEGAVERIAPGSARPSDLYRAFGGGRLGAPVGVRVSGDGRLVARDADGVERGALAIHGVAAPVAIELREFTRWRTSTDETVHVVLAPANADDEPIAGVRGAWEFEATGRASLWTYGDREAILRAAAPVRATIEVRVGGARIEASYDLAPDAP